MGIVTIDDRLHEDVRRATTVTGRSVDAQPSSGLRSACWLRRIPDITLEKTVFIADSKTRLVGDPTPATRLFHVAQGGDGEGDRVDVLTRRPAFSNGGLADA